MQTGEITDLTISWNEITANTYIKCLKNNNKKDTEFKKFSTLTRSDYPIINSSNKRFIMKYSELITFNLNELVNGIPFFPYTYKRELADVFNFNTNFVNRTTVNETPFSNFNWTNFKNLLISKGNVVINDTTKSTTSFVLDALKDYFYTQFKPYVALNYNVTDSAERFNLSSATGGYNYIGLSDVLSAVKFKNLIDYSYYKPVVYETTTPSKASTVSWPLFWNAKNKLQYVSYISSMINIRYNSPYDRTL
jgi:hypothetical protein